MAQKITLQDLAARIADPNVPMGELAPYFRPAANRTHPFSVDIQLNETLVEGAVRRGRMAIDFFNSYYAERRQRAYQHKIAQGWAGIRLLAEGDSWFEYPDPFGIHDDIVDSLSDVYAIYCVSAAGDTLEHMVAGADDLEARIAAVNPHGFLFSAGGNDIAGPELQTYLHEFEPGRDESNTLTPAFDAFIARVEQTYDRLFARLAGRFPTLHIFCHGYDWALPQPQGDWLGPQFAARHIPEALWAPIIRLMIDAFNAALARIAGRAGDLVHYVDCRGAIGGVSEWRDELHGREPGCLRVAGRFRKAIDATFPGLARAGRRTGAAPAGTRAPASTRELAASAAFGTGPFAVANASASHVVIEMFGGDNNLSSFVLQDMAEMAAGCPPSVAVLAIADFVNAPASVVEIGPNGPRTLEQWGEIDTGDPETLARFLTRALRTWPHARKAIGFWDHGTGVFDETDATENLTFQKMASVPRSQRTRSWPRRRLFFPKSRLADQPGIRAMLHDDTNGGLLTNLEAGKLLEAAFAEAGQEGKVDLIFSDTCLNGMIEVLEQLKDYAVCVVGSPDLEPGAGWNYRRWLSMAGGTPPASPDAWAAQAVEAYGEEYAGQPALHPCVMGAFRSDNAITAAFAKLVDVVNAGGRSAFFVIDQARAGAQGFANRDSYDIEDFASRIAALAPSSALAQAAQDLSAACDRARVESVALGRMVKRSHGLAFWFPGSQYALFNTRETYERLAFNKATGWVECLDRHR